MPFIKRLKPGRFPSLDGDKAYEIIEVDEMGNPVVKRPASAKKYYKSATSLTEEKIGPGLRAPDTRKGYKENQIFDYHLYNKLRSLGKIKKKGGKRK